MTSKGLKFQTFYMKNGNSLDLWKVILEIQHWTSSSFIPKSLLAAGPHGPFWRGEVFVRIFDLSHIGQVHITWNGWKKYSCHETSSVVVDSFARKTGYDSYTLDKQFESGQAVDLDVYCSYLTLSCILSNQFMIFHLSWKVSLGKTGGCLRMNLGRQG